MARLKQTHTIKADDLEKAEQAEGAFHLPQIKRTSPARKAGYIALSAALLFVLTTVALRAAYSGKLYPGTWGEGSYLGGLSQQAAINTLDEQTKEFQKSNIVLVAGTKTTKVSPQDISLSYDNARLVHQLMQLGRQGSLVHQIAEQWSLLVGGSSHDSASYSLDLSKLGDITTQLNSSIATPSTNAYYAYDSGTITFSGGVAGKRLDFGQLGLTLGSYLGQLNTDPITIPTTAVPPAISTATLTTNKPLAESYVKNPLVLTYGDRNWQVDPATALSWLHSEQSSRAQVAAPNLLTAYYTFAVHKSADTLDFDADKIASYLTTISKDIDQAPQDAALTVVDNRATVFAQSKNGLSLNIPKSKDAILTSLGSESASRSVALSVDITKPAVTEDNIDNLGIRDLLSEGVSYFPGSPPNRLTNVRVGAARFNGVLLKPGEVFSFGTLLGPVGAEQGYVPGLIILEDHEEMAYGGGLCQVSSTAYRAALLAGLPILERTNHAFAISYYTAPYGVPGVDATIYFPPVDMKFRNDTDAHILIQTEMVGSTLKFRFYGTKKKEGVIRGPFFVSGDADVNKPSHTIFYRDVIVDGKVIKTDAVNTYYKSALDYPVAD